MRRPWRTHYPSSGRRSRISLLSGIGLHACERDHIGRAPSCLRCSLARFETRKIADMHEAGLKREHQPKHGSHTRVPFSRALLNSSAKARPPAPDGTSIGPEQSTVFILMRFVLGIKPLWPAGGRVFPCLLPPISGRSDRGPRGFRSYADSSASGRTSQRGVIFGLMHRSKAYLYSTPSRRGRAGSAAAAASQRKMPAMHCACLRTVTYRQIPTIDGQ